MICDAQVAGGCVALDQIDGAAQPNAIQNDGFLVGAGGVAVGIASQPETEFEMFRSPIRISRGGVLQPATQVGAEAFDFAPPDARDGRSEFVFVARRHTVQNLVGEVELLGKAPFHARLFAEEFKLRGMKNSAARESVHLFQRRGLLSRPELKDSVQSEAIWAG